MNAAKAMALFAVPSFKSGVAASLDLGSTLRVYNTSKNSEEADSKAIYSDWAAVGYDIHYAVRRWEADHHGEEE